MKYLIRYSAAVAAFALPTIAFAQGANVSQGLEGTMSVVSRLVNGVVGLLIVLALVAFFWGVIRYMFGGAADKSQGIKFMISGVIVIFVMVSIWGIVALLQNTFGVGGNQRVQFNPNPPQGMDPRNGIPGN